MNKTKEVWRITMSTEVVFELLELLDITRDKYGLSLNLAGFRKRISSLAHDAAEGNRTPAYVASGIKRESAINLDSLGATAQEKVRVTDFAHLRQDEIDAELEKLNDAMLAELAAAGNPNVILEERRNPERLASESAGNEDNADSSNDELLFKFLKGE